MNQKADKKHHLKRLTDDGLIVSLHLSFFAGKSAKTISCVTNPKYNKTTLMFCCSVTCAKSTHSSFAHSLGSPLSDSKLITTISISVCTNFHSLSSKCLCVKNISVEFTSLKKKRENQQHVHIHMFLVSQYCSQGEDVLLSFKKVKS